MNGDSRFTLAYANTHSHCSDMCACIINIIVASARNPHVHTHKKCSADVSMYFKVDAVPCKTDTRAMQDDEVRPWVSPRNMWTHATAFSTFLASNEYKAIFAKKIAFRWRVGAVFACLCVSALAPILCSTWGRRQLRTPHRSARTSRTVRVPIIWLETSATPHAALAVTRAHWAPSTTLGHGGMAFSAANAAATITLVMISKEGCFFLSHSTKRACAAFGTVVNFN